MTKYFIITILILCLLLVTLAFVKMVEARILVNEQVRIRLRTQEDFEDGVAGRYYHDINTIDLNIDIPPSLFAKTFIHELAHVKFKTRTDQVIFKSYLTDKQIESIDNLLDKPKNLWTKIDIANFDYAVEKEGDWLPEIEKQIKPSEKIARWFEKYIFDRHWLKEKYRKVWYYFNNLVR